MVDQTTIEISDGAVHSRYVKCASKNNTATQSFVSQSAGLPQNISQCVSTVITSITDRFGQKVSPSPSKDGFDPGTAIDFANGDHQVSYEKEPAILRSKIGDQMQMCLSETPRIARRVTIGAASTIRRTSERERHGGLPTPSMFVAAHNAASGTTGT